MSKCKNCGHDKISHLKGLGCWGEKLPPVKYRTIDGWKEIKDYHKYCSCKEFK